MSAIIHVASGAVVRGGRVLLVKRALGKSHGGKWVTPGGKVQSGEGLKLATCREIREECAIKVDEIHVGEALYEYSVPSTTTNGRVCLVTCRRITWNPGMGEVRLKLDEVDGFAWFAPNELEEACQAGWLGPADRAGVRELVGACR
jgi:8-oxo-dGTP pyrophosphatase MutT (NUDIX family)